MADRFGQFHLGLEFGIIFSSLARIAAALCYFDSDSLLVFSRTMKTGEFAAYKVWAPAFIISRNLPITAGITGIGLPVACWYDASICRMVEWHELRARNLWRNRLWFYPVFEVSYAVLIGPSGWCISYLENTGHYSPDILR